MERKFYPENFEKFLKEHVDNFKMTPSKKTWHGIYNDLHPGRRWPSVTMSFVFIFALVIISHLNTNNGHDNAFNLKVLSAANIKSSTSSGLKTSSSSSADTKANKPAKTTTNSFKEESNLPESKAISHNSNTITSNNQDKIENTVTQKTENISIESGTTITPELQNTTPENVEQSNTEIENNKTALPEVINKTNTPVKKELKTEQADNLIVIKPKKVRNNPAIFTYYFSPSLSYRSFSDSKINNSVIHKAMIGYEAGSNLKINIFKQLQFTTGLQLNFSGYNIKASSTHPIVASIALNTDVPGVFANYSTMSVYGNGTGNENTKLKNYSVQLSAPIGFAYSFGGNDDVTFNAEATVQPSYLIKSKAYLLSTDGKNYLTDPDIFRNWNMSTNLGAYVSFKSNSFNWHIGPQFRYQMLSTYIKEFPLKEHLINYGVRIGISKISK
jgi:hypothetical protein